MPDDDKNQILRYLREMREAQESFRKDFQEFRKDLRSMYARIEQMHESAMSALGIASQANLRHEIVRAEVDLLRVRMERLEADLTAPS